MELRDYQEEALGKIVAAVKDGPDVLLQAATGGGKTCVFSALVRTFQESYGMRILVLAHREQLVRQARDKLLQWWPDGEGRIGLACAAVGKVDLSRPVVIGSPQTLANRLAELPAFHMTVVDEAHRLPPRNSEGQYTAIVGRLRELYPKMRLLGVTATPYRLKHGYIYGDECRDPEANWFPRLCWSIGIAELQKRGWLCPLEAFTAEKPDLTKVKISKTGEFDFKSLSETMSAEIHLDSAVKALETYGPERRHVVVFAVTIKHAEMLAERFRMAGHAVGLVHSRLPHAERMETLERFERGELRVVVNVGVLTEGWDSTAIDCIVLCRPTKSTALYVQMVGRGLRIHPDKSDCLLLDLSGNHAMHGPVQEPRVTWKPPREAREQEEDEAPKIIRCPACRSEVKAGDIVCPACGYELKKMVEDCPRLERVSYSAMPWPRPMAIVGRPKITPDFWTRSGRHMFRIRMYCTDDGSHVYMVSAVLDLEGQAGAWGREKARKVWNVLGRPPAPRTLKEAAGRIGELEFPSAILVEKSRDGRWYNVRRWYA